MTNRQVLLARRPQAPSPAISHRRCTDADAWRRRGAGATLALARSCADDERAVVCSAGGDRRGHGRPDRGRGRRIARPAFVPTKPCSRNWAGSATAGSSERWPSIRNAHHRRHAWRWGCQASRRVGLSRSVSRSPQTVVASAARARWAASSVSWRIGAARSDAGGAAKCDYVVNELGFDTRHRPRRATCCKI